MDNKLLRSGFGLAGGTMFSRVFGLARDVAIASTFGAGSGTDAFFIAQRIPNLFRRMFAEGAFSAAFVPLLSAAQQESQQAMLAFAQQCFLRLALYLLLLTAVVQIAAAPVAWLFAPGFYADSEQFSLLVDLLRLTFPYLLLIALAGLCASWLQCHGKFAATAYAPVLLNICLIVAAGYAYYGDGGIIYLGLAILIAGILQFALLLWQAQLQGLRLSWSWRPHAKLARLYRLMLPTMFSASVTQLSLLIDSILASTLIAASVSWLYFADRLVELPLGLIGISIATVVLPKLSALHSQQDLPAYQRTLDWALRLTLGLALPATIALIMLAEPLIRLIYQHNAFDPSNIIPVQQALIAYALGLPFFMLIKLLTNAFFARQDSKTPMRCALFATGVNIALSLLLVRYYAHVGLALATSIGAATNALLLALILQRRGWYSCFARANGRAILLVVLACLGMLAYLFYAQLWLGAWLQSSSLQGSWLQLAAAMALLCLGGLLLYLAIWWLLTNLFLESDDAAA